MTQLDPLYLESSNQKYAYQNDTHGFIFLTGMN